MPRLQLVHLVMLFALLVAATAFGGWSYFSWRDAVLAALAAAGLATVLAMPAADARGARIERIALATALLPGLYLVPLPPGVADALSMPVPGAAAGGWRPLSFAVDETWRAWLKLAPIAIGFVLARRLHAVARLRVVAFLLALAVLEALWGLAQVAGGAESALRPFGADVVAAATGSFANRNHYAALFVLLLPWCCWLATDGDRTAPRGRAPMRRHAVSVAGVLALSIGFAAVAASRSRAGAAIAVLQFVVMAASAIRREPRTYVIAGLVIVTLALGALLASVASTPLMDRLAADPWRRERVEILHHGLQAATASLPLGTGPGTFAAVYPAFETSETLHPFYVNRAHNEVIELGVEIGLLAPLLALVALAFLGRAFVDGWRAAAHGGQDAWRLPAATALLGLALHSMVDYPLRAPLVALIASTLVAMLAAAPAARGR